MKEKYKYEITLEYFADNESRYFRGEVEADDNVQAMEIIIGRIAWQTSNEGKTFKFNFIHYDCL
jgi:hypothetical protein